MVTFAAPAAPLSSFSLVLIDPRGRVAFESVYMSGPEGVDRSEPDIHS
jgi:hypothetical protein